MKKLRIKAILPHILFALVGVGVLTAMFVYRDFKFREGDEHLNRFIEKHNLEQAASEEWLPNHKLAIDYDTLMDAYFDLYEEDAVYFLLRYLDSPDVTRKALALRTLQLPFARTKGCMYAASSAPLD